MRLVAAMSGGVDSAVAAARAVDAGHDVTGVHLALVQGTHSGCCTPEDARDARRAADTLGIPFYVWDFAAVLDRALALGFDGIVTGHHARLALEDGRPALRRSVDPGKDQSYVLGTLRPEQLRHAVFPLGDTDKGQVRREAAERGLAVAEKPDSHDVCFVGRGRTGDWLRDRLGPQPGPIVSSSGEVLGEHDGAYAFTVGQRRGVPLGGGLVEPRYVLSVSPVTRTVVVGTADELGVSLLSAGDSTYPGGERRVQVQLRAHGEPIDAVVTPGRDGFEVRLDVPARGIAAGQAVVLYEPDAERGDLVLGGGRITATAPAAQPV